VCRKWHGRKRQVFWNNFGYAMWDKMSRIIDGGSQYDDILRNNSGTKIHLHELDRIKETDPFLKPLLNITRQTSWGAPCELERAKGG
jgi:hypothetical protein